MQKDPLDPRGLIREAYRIAGITPGECRSIFLDWALNASDGAETKKDVQTLLHTYADEPSDHPMTQVLEAALLDVAAPRRRGGRAGRPAN